MAIPQKIFTGFSKQFNSKFVEFTNLNYLSSIEDVKDEIFVVFRNSQVLPLYLIQFRTQLGMNFGHLLKK